MHKRSSLVHPHLVGEPFLGVVFVPVRRGNGGGDAQHEDRRDGRQSESQPREHVRPAVRHTAVPVQFRDARPTEKRSCFLESAIPQENIRVLKSKLNLTSMDVSCKIQQNMLISPAQKFKHSVPYWTFFLQHLSMKKSIFLEDH